MLHRNMRLTHVRGEAHTHTHRQTAVCVGEQREQASLHGAPVKVTQILRRGTRLHHRSLNMDALNVLLSSFIFLHLSTDLPEMAMMLLFFPKNTVTSSYFKGQCERDSPEDRLERK